ncbi:DUF6783 domain-containing protein [Anaerosporobacter sp.]|uniref:DUF6783 domain-containing protein n=1 Tax=Anaerosporobacter sp. TaxID=1872529 RepID=UPI00286F7A75|nr:DUF6783 domain-containing protein [Anaerosporobacter sp.]
MELRWMESRARACLKIDFTVLHPPLSGLKVQNSVNIARYASRILDFQPTKWSAQSPVQAFFRHTLGIPIKT